MPLKDGLKPSLKSLKNFINIPNLVSFVNVELLINSC